MNVNGREGNKVWLPLFFSLVLIAGMVLGFNLRDTLRNKRSIATVIERNDRLEEIIDLISDKYVDTINSNLLYRDAVSGILRSLDPHTVYIPAEEVQGVNDELEGGFSGIGVEFSIIRDTIEVVSVIENSPASQAGVEMGDQIIKVGDTLVAGNKTGTDRIMRMLKGKQKTHVYVTLLRPASGRLKQVAITRDIVPTYSIEASLMVDAATGFIKINRFSATTYAEFSAALKRLQGQGATQLIIDLRDNPGGYLDAATSIADDLLSGGKLIVYTQGLHTLRTDYKASGKGLFEQGRLAILVDEGSASASEILSGAVQDWDRGTIIGRRSFGKGLVQEQYEMPDGAALRLTIARYYTPSGRCIQRSFARGRDAYLEDYQKRVESDVATGKDSMAAADTVTYFTAHRRHVYGGGGITPDVFVPYDTVHSNAALMALILQSDLRTAIWDYYTRNREKLKYKDIAAFNASFADEPKIENSYLATLKPEIKRAALILLSHPANQAFFTLQIRAQVARLLFRDNGYYAITLKDDAVVAKALLVMGSAEYLKIINGQ